MKIVQQEILNSFFWIKLHKSQVKKLHNSVIYA